MHLRHVNRVCCASQCVSAFQRALSFQAIGHACNGYERSVRASEHTLSTRMTSSATKKPTDVELVEASVERIIGGGTPHNLVDIGINLADSSYDKVSG